MFMYVALVRSRFKRVSASRQYDSRWHGSVPTRLSKAVLESQLSHVHSLIAFASKVLQVVKRVTPDPPQGHTAAVSKKM